MNNSREILIDKLSRARIAYADPSLYIAIRHISSNNNDEYVFANERVLKLFNLTSGNLSSITRRELIYTLPNGQTLFSELCKIDKQLISSSNQVKQRIDYQNESGDAIPLEVTLSPIMSDESELIGIVTVIREIINTAGKPLAILEDEIYTHIHQVRSLRGLLEVNDIANSGINEDEIFTEIMRKIKEVMITETSSLLLYNQEDENLYFTVALGEAGKCLQGSQKMSLDKGIAGWVATNQEPLIVNEAYQDFRFNRLYDEKTGFITKAIICAPLIYRGQLLGVIQAINPISREKFTQFDMEIFRLFAGLLSTAVSRMIISKNMKITKRNSLKLLFKLLSSKEKSYIIYFARGYSRREIAKKMDILPETCDAFSRRIKKKTVDLAFDFDTIINDIKTELDTDFNLMNI